MYFKKIYVVCIDNLPNDYFFVGKMVESKKALPKEPRGGYGGYVGYPGMPGGGRMPFLPGSACVLDAQLDNSDLIEHSGWNR